MLRVENYTDYEEKTKRWRKRRLQLSKYHLRRWGTIEKNFSTLSPYQKRIARSLFVTLKQMTAEEREFLAEKYRNIPTPVTEKELAKKYNMEIRSYSELRKGIEYKFFYYLKDTLRKNTVLINL